MKLLRLGAILKAFRDSLSSGACVLVEKNARGARRRTLWVDRESFPVKTQCGWGGSATLFQRQILHRGLRRHIARTDDREAIHGHRARRDHLVSSGPRAGRDCARCPQAIRPRSVSYPAEWAAAQRLGPVSEDEQIARDRWRQAIGCVNVAALMQ
jgi:hypothetical protein